MLLLEAVLHQVAHLPVEAIPLFCLLDQISELFLLVFEDDSVLQFGEGEDVGDGSEGFLSIGLLIEAEETTEEALFFLFLPVLLVVVVDLCLVHSEDPFLLHSSRIDLPDLELLIARRFGESDRHLEG